MGQYRTLFILLLIIACGKSEAQNVHGKVTNTKMEPLAFVSVEVKGSTNGTISNEEGNYNLKMEEGKYDLVFSMVGYESQLVTIVVDKRGTIKNIILQEDASGSLSTVVIKKKMKDPAEEIIRNVIRHKDEIMAASGAYSCTLYIKAVQEDSLSSDKNKRNKNDTIEDVNKDIRQMAMAEVALHLDYESLGRMKEERIGATKGRRFSGLFYLSATEGDFNFYNNLLKVPSVSEIPILSPVSYSGLIAYKFKTKEIIKDGARKIYVISVKPGKLSNATVEGEITIEDSSWVILHTKFSFPKYHLPEYDFFEVEQDYQFINNKAWMISRQQFAFFSKAGKRKVSGHTSVSYKDFELNKSFDKKHFGVEVSATEQLAYERDSTFWETIRTEPLTEKEIRYIRYKDSIYTATHTREYLDSVDRVINKITWQKVVFKGITHSNHELGTNWYFGTLPSIFQPLQFGGSRLGLFFNYSKVYKSKKFISLWNNLSYGIRNQDVNGTIRFSKLYNPFKRSYYNITVDRNFEFIFQGDAWINMLKRSNYYLKSGIGIGHNFEIANGLYLFTDMNVAFRRSVSNYKTNGLVDSLFGDVLENNQAVSFQPYNATYGQVRLQYTPRQRYIREPNEKIILGSDFPTFYVSWRKGIPGLINSKVDFDYLEFGIEQTLKLGLAGLSNYTFRSGSFLSQKDLRMIDYKFERQGDPFLFLNPRQAFQALDSTFPVFKRFYEMHYVHDFNGAIINKIPLLKKLQLREVGGGGFLYAQERNLKYAEAFVGIERVLKWPFNPLTKFKLGVYVVGSAANQFKNPVQFKIGITSWDKMRNQWF